ncbi:signal peptidase II [bacterium]|nr:signal peptidase II [bacterium]
MRTEARRLLAVADQHLPVPVSRYVLFTGLVVGLTAIDLASKQFVFSSLGWPGKSEWEWRAGDWVRFQLQTNVNFGALWGLGQGFSGLFALFSVVAVVGVLYFLFVLKHARSMWLTVALAGVLSGALGNLYDRLGWHGLIDPRDGSPVYGVRDFLDFQFFGTFNWAIFNYADSFLVIGSIMLVIHSFREEQKSATSAITENPNSVAAIP